MTEGFRVITMVMSFGAFAGMIVLFTVYARDHDRRWPLPLALALMMFSVADYNFTNVHRGVTQYTFISCLTAALTIYCVFRTGLWGSGDTSQIVTHRKEQDQ